MRDVISAVAGVAVAIGLLVGLSAVMASTTGAALSAPAFLLLALVLFPLCVAVALRITRPKVSTPSRD